MIATAAMAQTAVQSLIDAETRNGPEIGLQVAVYQHGRLVVDAWSGWADPARTQPVAADTLFTVYSVSKGITATAVHLLAERGLVAYDTPIAAYWPAFGANGKGDLTVRHALLHTAGMMNIPPEVSVLDQTDWAGMCGRMAAGAPAFAPGSLRVYHALTFGWILGGLVEAVTGQSFTDFLAAEFVAPLGLEMLAMGVPAAALPRIATLVEAPELLAPLAVPRPFPNTAPPGFLGAATMNQAALRRACLPGHGMITNARSLAGFYAGLVGDGLGGVRTLGAAQTRLATTEAMNAPMQPGDPPARTGLGYGLGGDSPVLGPRVSAFGHGGYGGAVGMADPELGLAIGVTKNYLFEGPPEAGATYRIVETVRRTLGAA